MARRDDVDYLIQQGILVPESAQTPPSNGFLGSIKDYATKGVEALSNLMPGNEEYQKTRDEVMAELEKSPEWQQYKKDTGMVENPAPGTFQQQAQELGKGLIGEGIGGLISGTGAALNYLGAPKMAEKLESYTKPVEEAIKEQPLKKEFEFSDLGTREYWSSGQGARDIGNMLGNVAAFALPLTAGEYAAGTLIGKFVSSPLTKGVAQTLVTAYTNRKMQALMNAGQVYETVLNQTGDKDAAMQAANYVNSKDMNLMAVEITQWATMLMPSKAGKTLASKVTPYISKPLTVGATQAGELVYQDIANKEAVYNVGGLAKEPPPKMLEPSTWGPEEKKAAFMGGSMGLGMGLTAARFNKLQAKAKENTDVPPPVVKTGEKIPNENIDPNNPVHVAIDSMQPGELQTAIKTLLENPAFEGHPDFGDATAAAGSKDYGTIKKILAQNADMVDIPASATARVMATAAQANEGQVPQGVQDVINNLMNRPVPEHVPGKAIPSPRGELPPVQPPRFMNEQPGRPIEIPDQASAIVGPNGVPIYLRNEANIPYPKKTQAAPTEPGTQARLTALEGRQPGTLERPVEPLTPGVMRTAEQKVDERSLLGQFKNAMDSKNYATALDIATQLRRPDLMTLVDRAGGFLRPKEVTPVAEGARNPKENPVPQGPLTPSNKVQRPRANEETQQRLKALEKQAEEQKRLAVEQRTPEPTGPGQTPSVRRTAPEKVADTFARQFKEAMDARDFARAIDIAKRAGNPNLLRAAEIGALKAGKGIEIPKGQSPRNRREIVTPTTESVGKKGGNKNKLHSGFDITGGRWDEKSVGDILKPLVGKIREAFPHLVDIGRQVIREGAANLKDFATRMKQYLGEHWNAFRSQIGKVYEQAKAALNNERGSVRIGLKEESANGERGRQVPGNGRPGEEPARRMGQRINGPWAEQGTGGAGNARTSLTNAKTFHTVMSEVHKQLTRPAFVEVHPQEHYVNSRNYLTADKKAGFAITKDGDFISLFRHKTSPVEGERLVLEAISKGAKKGDFFASDKLMDLYSKAGFDFVGRTPFNEEFAPKDWNYARDDHPDIIAMVKRQGKPLDKTPSLDSIKLYKSYDEMMSARDAMVPRTRVVIKLQEQRLAAQRGSMRLGPAEERQQTLAERLAPDKQAREEAKTNGEGIKNNSTIFQGMREKLATKLTGEKPAENVKVADKSNPENIKLSHWIFHSASKIAEKYPKFRPFEKLANQGQQIQERLRKKLTDRLNSIYENVNKSQKDWDDFQNVRIASDLAGKDPTPAELKAMGVSDNVIKALRMTRNLYDHVLTIANIVRKLSGQPPVERLPGYFPHQFHEWWVIVPNGKSDGSWEYRTFKNYKEAVKAANELSKQHPDKEILVRNDPFTEQIKRDALEAKATTGEVISEDELKRISRAFEFRIKNGDGAEILAALEDKTNYHRRFANFLKRNAGIEGWNRDIAEVDRRYLMGIARYYGMELFKSKAVPLYEKTFGRNFFFEPTESVANKGTATERKVPSYFSVDNFTHQYIHDVNGDPAKVDRLTDELLYNFKLANRNVGGTVSGRPSIQVANAVQRVVSIATLGLYRVSAMVTQLFQLQNGYTKLAGKYWWRGIQETFKPTPEALRVLKAVGVAEQMSLANIGGYSEKGVWGKTGMPEWNKVYKFISQELNRSMKLFIAGDQYTRKATALGAFYKAREELKMNYADAINYARKINLECNFNYGKVDDPNLFRRAGAFGNALLQFKKFPVKQLEFALSLHSWPERARFAGTIMLLSGLFEMPLEDNLLSVLQKFGFDFKAEGKKYLMDWAGGDPLRQFIAKSAIYGPISALTNIDISRSAGMGDFADFTPLLVSKIMQATKIQARLSASTVTDVLKVITPQVANIITALNGEVSSSQDRDRLSKRYDSVFDRVAKFGGFRTMSEAIESDQVQIKKEIEARYQKNRERALVNVIEKPTSENFKKAGEYNITSKQINEEMKKRTQTRYERAMEGIPKNRRQEYEKMQQFR